MEMTILSNDDTHGEGQSVMRPASENAPGEPERAERLPEWMPRRRNVLVALYVVVLLLAGGLAYAAHTFSMLPGDLAITRELQESSSPLIYWPLYAISYIGYPLQSAVVVTAVVAVLLALRHWIAALFCVATLLADAFVAVLKVVVARQRPTSQLVHVVTPLNSQSFPSGHVVHYTVFYGFLICVLLVSFRPSWLRNGLIAICAALIVLVGISRVYLGEHWASDVLGGYLIGCLFLVPLVAIYMRVRRRYLASQHARRSPPRVAASS